MNLNFWRRKNNEKLARLESNSINQPLEEDIAEHTCACGGNCGCNHQHS